MRNIHGLLLAASSAALFAGGTAAAQTTTSGPPNFGNYQALDGLYRVGINAQSPIGTTNIQRAFEQDELDDITQYLDPAEIAAYIGGTQGALFAQQGSITAVFDLRGGLILGSYNTGSPILTVRAINPDGTTFEFDGAPCSFSYNGATRAQSFAQFDAATDDETTPTSRRLLGCAAASLVRYSPIDPLAGNPNSLQASLARGALDMTSGDSLIEEAGPTGDTANTAGDPWIIGASIGFGTAGRFDMTRIDARIARGFRVFEGGRSRLKIDLPFNYSRLGGVSAYTAQLGIGLEIPVATHFSIEPRVSYGATGGEAIGQVGHILQGTIAARGVFYGLGRGRVVLGLMGGYAKTLDTPFSDLNLNPQLTNGVFRGGAAYETPLNLRLGGRASSLRASYSFTQYTGDELFNNNFHEFALSFGLRTREEQVRGSRDLIRFNASTIQASNFSQYTFGIGFRF